MIWLLAVLAVAAAVGPRLPVPMPVVLALAGAALAFVPEVPHLKLDPDLILIGFLPPLLYADAFDTSWIDFRRWLRPIVMLAVGLVAFTILVVGVTAHACLPDLPWPACFILGAVVSPTDMIAVRAVIEKLHVPRRATAILGGESLVNDATGLVGVQVGVAVVLSGAFSLGEVTLHFARVAGGGLAIGAAVGLVFANANRFVREKHVLFVLSLLAPYLAFIIAHGLGTSGVLAVVVAGFVVAWRIHSVPPEARVELFSTWEMITFLLNGLCFLFVGFETPNLLRQVVRAEDRSTLVVAALAVSAAAIVARMAWMFPAAYLPLLASKRLRRKEGGLPSWRIVTLAGWCGARGVVSLAAALSLPTILEDDTEFPGRQAIVICTLAVILVTLIVQSSTLTPLIRLLGIRGDEDSGEEVRGAREKILSAGIARLDAYCSEKSCPLSVHHLRTLMADELTSLGDDDEDERKRASTRLAVSHDVRREVGRAQEAALLALRDRGAINDKTYVELQLELDRARMDHIPSRAGTS